mgnify:CR=1 FL=1|tara:strand:- start:2427 stop:2660 length:234 start_codon:yes stop_codon:yes gene_type:complete
MVKLNKYIHGKMLEVEYEALPWSEDDIEQWIIDWYNDTFKELGRPEDKDKPRGPPMWLAGKRWYDRKLKMQQQSEKE